MHYDALVRTVAHRVGLGDPAQAERATRTALRLLPPRLPEPVMRRLTRQLDPSLAGALSSRLPPPADTTGDDYVADLAERCGLDAVRAARVARVVLQALEVDTAGELSRVPHSQLPEDVRDLLRRRTAPGRAARLGRQVREGRRVTRAA